MTIERTFETMEQQLGNLRDTMEALRTTVEEDRPHSNDVIVASRLSDGVLAAIGYLQESMTLAQAAREAVTWPLDPHRAQRTLALCQQRFHRFANYFLSELASFDRIDDLQSVGREHGRSWMDWAAVVTQALEQCRSGLEETRNAFLLSWQDLVERITAPPVSIQAANRDIRQLAAHASRQQLDRNEPQTSSQEP